MPPKNLFSSSFALRQVCEKTWVGYVLGLFTAILCIAFFVFPMPGYAVVAMSVVGGFIALRPKMRVCEKSMWIVLLVLLGGVEIRAIRRDRTDRDNAQNAIVKEERQRFEGIANDLKTSISKIDAGNTMLKGLTARIDENVKAKAQTQSKPPSKEVELKLSTLDLSTKLLTYVRDWQAEADEMRRKIYAEPVASPGADLRQQIALDRQRAPEAAKRYQKAVIKTLNSVAAAGTDATGIPDGAIHQTVLECNSFADRFTVAKCAEDFSAIATQMK